MSVNYDSIFASLAMEGIIFTDERRKLIIELAEKYGNKEIDLRQATEILRSKKHENNDNNPISAQGKKTAQ